MVREQLANEVQVAILADGLPVFVSDFSWVTPDVLVVSVGVNDVGQVDRYVFHLQRTIDALTQGKFTSLRDEPSGEDASEGGVESEPPFPF